MDPPAILPGRQDFRRQEIDEDDDDSIDFKMWQGSLPHKNTAKCRILMIEHGRKAADCLTKQLTATVNKLD